MNFNKTIQQTSHNYAYYEEGYFVWCGTMFKHNESYYLIYSRWPQETGFKGWVTDSEVCLAKSDTMLGKFRFVKRLFDTSNDEIKLVTHNPTVITHNGKYYLYYMMNRSDGEWWDHRNNQRVGVAYTDDPEGEWVRPEAPVIDISEEGIDSLMTSNPSACIMPDGRTLMVYKAVSKYGEMPKGGKVLCGAAIADDPCGPFVKFGEPLFENPENPWSVEDPYIWCEDGRFYALVKDYHGYFPRTKGSAVALFESSDGRHWECSKEAPLAFEPILDYGWGRTLRVRNLERPQLYIEDGIPKLLLCACMINCPYSPTFNIRIPLDWKKR